MGEICAERVAPRAAEADEEGAHFETGEVTYAAPTLDAIDAFRQAGLFGAMLPREYGGLNLPESIYSMLVEMVARAESGLMTVYGLQEIASMIEEYADEETKARVLPHFSRGEVSGAMVLTEADAGSDLGAVATRATLDEATGQWQLNGVKRFITNGLADVSVVLARSEEGSHRRPRPVDVPGRARRDGQDPPHRAQDGHPLVAHVRDPVRQHAGRPDRQAPLRAHALRHEPDERRAPGRGRPGPRHRRGRLPRGRRLLPRAHPVRQADPGPPGGRPAAALDAGGPRGHPGAAGRDQPLGGPVEGLREGRRRGRRGGSGRSGPPQAVRRPWPRR